MTKLPFHIPGNAPRIKPAIDRYLLHLYQRGRSQATIRAYGWHLYKAFLWLETRECTQIDALTENELLLWGVHLREQYSPQTQKQGIVAMRGFLQYHLGSDNPSRILVTPKQTISPQRTLTAGEIEKMLHACPETPIGIRNQALMALMVDVGLRANEICTAQLRDLDMVTSSLIVTSKGGTRDKVFFSPFCAGYLRNWLRVRPPTLAETIFVSIGGITPGRALTPRGLRIIIRTCAQHAQIPNVHPHAFRRAFATLRIKAGQPTRTVQIIGRWKDLKTFERYSQVLLDDQEYRRAAAAAYSPLRSITKER